MINAIKYFMGKVVESHPYSWSLAWSLMHKWTFLLPHDKSYWALRHFCGHAEIQLFLDIGANTGISALTFRKINRIIPIYSIEPNNIHSKSLNKIKKRLQPFDFLLMGVGDKEMTAEFFTPVYNKIILHTFTSGSEMQVRNAVKKSFGDKIANNLIIHKSFAPIICLDTLKLAPSIIKIDAEGFDFNVLVGAKNTLQLHRPFIMFEACHTDIERFQVFFTGIDYTILTYQYADDNFSYFNPNMLNSISGGRNVFAVPNSKLLLLPLSEQLSH